MRKETEWEQERGTEKEREAVRETEAEGGSGGWQALLSADSDMAVGDR